MNRFVKIVLHSLIATVQILTLIVGFFAYTEMNDMLSRAEWTIKILIEEAGGPIVISAFRSNPFNLVAWLVLLGLALTIVLLIDEIRLKPEGDKQNAE
jgi:hypothetical protein